MKPYQRALAYLTVAAGLGGAGCEKPLDPVKPSQLESVVHAATKAEELDLSTPEDPVRLYFKALTDADIRQGHELYLQISHEQELGKFENWQKAVSESKLYAATVDGAKQNGNKGEVLVTMDYEKKGKRRKGSGNVEVVCIEGKWKLATK